MQMTEYVIPTKGFCKKCIKNSRVFFETMMLDNDPVFEDLIIENKVCPDDIFCPYANLKIHDITCGYQCIWSQKLFQ